MSSLDVGDALEAEQRLAGRVAVALAVSVVAAAVGVHRYGAHERIGAGDSATAAPAVAAPPRSRERRDMRAATTLSNVSLADGFDTMSSSMMLMTLLALEAIGDRTTPDTRECRKRSWHPDVPPVNAR